jgi:ribonuclease HI
MLWGNHAKKKKSLIHEDCFIYEWIHPSPLAQTNKNIQFIDCNHFTEVNKLLTEFMDVSPIDWNPQVEHIVFTDGACSNNGKGIFSTTGYSAYFSKGLYASMVFYGKVPPSIVDSSVIYGTNQRGECIGIIRALELVLKGSDHQNKINNKTKKKQKIKTTLITDSKFWKDMIETYMPNWEMKHIDFKTKKNPDLTIKLYDLVKKVKKCSEFKIVHVQSHSKNPNSVPEHVKGNIIADKYAVKGKGLDSYDEVCEFETDYT